MKAKPCAIKAKIDKARTELRALEQRLKGGRGKATQALKTVIAQAKTSLMKAEALAVKKCAEVKKAPPKTLPHRTSAKAIPKSLPRRASGEPKFRFFPEENVWRYGTPPKPGYSAVFRSGPRKGIHKDEGLALLQAGLREYPTVLKERKKRELAKERKLAKRLGRKVTGEGAKTLEFWRGLMATPES